MRALRIALLVVVNLGGIVLSKAGLKWSAASRDWRGFLWG